MMTSLKVMLPKSHSEDSASAMGRLFRPWVYNTFSKEDTAVARARINVTSGDQDSTVSTTTLTDTPIKEGKCTKSVSSNKPEGSPSSCKKLQNGRSKHEHKSRKRLASQFHDSAFSKKESSTALRKEESHPSASPSEIHPRIPMPTNISSLYPPGIAGSFPFPSSALPNPRQLFSSASSELNATMKQTSESENCAFFNTSAENGKSGEKSIESAGSCSYFGVPLAGTSATSSNEDYRQRLNVWNEVCWLPEKPGNVYPDYNAVGAANTAADMAFCCPDMLLLGQGVLPSPVTVEQYASILHQHQQHQLEQAKMARKQRPKKYRCPHCRVAFSNNGQLKGHIRIHTGERPYRCDVASCGKTFTRNEELTRHKRIHSGLRPFACPACGKRFGRKDHLKKHSRTHSTQQRLPLSLPAICYNPYLYGF